MNREKVKTIILTVLVVMSIFLTQKIWFVSPLTMLQSEASNLGVDQEQVLKIRREVLRPTKFDINLGGYHVNPAYNEDIWYKSKLILEDYFVGEVDVSLSTIEKYEEQKEFKSMEIHFGNNIPSVLISSVYGSIDNKIVRNVKEIQQILIPATSNGEIYILGNNNTVFSVVNINYNSTQITELFNYIEGRNYNRFYPLFSDIGNPVLMPLSFNNQLPQIYVESDINAADDSVIVEHAKTFFDRNFDFIKTIKETSGSTVFIYGYGEKSVRINNRGRLEYTEDVGNASSTNIISSLDVAIDFVLNHGKFPEDTYLSEIRPTEKNKGYIFGFSYKVNDRPIHFIDNINNTIEVEVYGDKVRNYKSFIRNPIDSPDVEASNHMILPHKIIDDNFELLKEDYLFNQDYEDNYTDEMLLNEINSVDLVYLDTLDNVSTQLIMPSWRITVEDNIYYFNAYDGKLIYKTVTN